MITVVILTVMGMVLHVDSHVEGDNDEYVHAQ